MADNIKRNLDQESLGRPKVIHNWVMATLMAIMGIGLIFSVVEKQWLNVSIIIGIVLLTLMPNMLGKRFEVHIPPEFEILAVLFIFASIFLGEVHGYYTRFWWWDVVLHISSGFLLGILGFLLVYALNQEEYIQLYMQPGFVALFSFTFAVAIGALWEIFEFAMDSFFGLNMQKSGLVDTMWDLIVDTVGALVISIMGYIYMKSGKTYFVERWISKFIQGNPKIFQREE